MVEIHTRNPATGEIIGTFQNMERDEVFRIAQACRRTWEAWRTKSVEERARYLERYATILRDRKKEYASLITVEMGKPITEALAEVEKCAWASEVFAEKSTEWLADESVEADGKAHTVAYQPLGLILSIMPWNFPFWQALRFAVPTLLAGNVSMLKHAKNVPGCAFAIETSFREAGLPDNTFRTILADHETVGELIASDLVQGVSLTGSTIAGMRIAETAGRALKKVVLELGGSDPFIVLDDADVGFAARQAVKGRTQNMGQSCIAAKRFIVDASLAEEFTAAFAKHLRDLNIGDPMNETTQIGPRTPGTRGRRCSSAGSGSTGRDSSSRPRCSREPIRA
jgi:succinate-semialdehyde dehydrogenase/glutarate-semialdehyde dehydrogenase